MNKPAVNAFTVDVEDYYHVQAFARYIPRARWDDYESRVVPGARKILEMLAERDIRGTFFVLGWVADRHPKLLREIRAAGHEVGSHSYWHRLVYEMTPEEFRDDLRRSKDAIENILGEPVRSYRAPCFSITNRSLWALDILADEGVRYDSSVFPIYHDRYGIPNANPLPHRIDTSRGPLWEFPASTVRLGRLNLPVAGGGYFRLYPASWTIRALKRLNRRGRPFVFYIHPWEVDPQQPRLRFGSRKSRLRHYLNLSRTAAKLRRLVHSCPFATLTESLHEAFADASKTIEREPATSKAVASPTGLARETA